MVAWANREALERTRATGLATFFSRARQTLWTKGETSGATLRVSRILVDCDGDTVLYQCTPQGPSCHTGSPTCFFRELAEGPINATGAAAAAPESTGTEYAGEVPADSNRAAPQVLLDRLEAVLEARKAATDAGSYTKHLYDGGAERMGAKVREEANELAQALAEEDDERVISEAADLLFHALVGLRARNVPIRSVLGELARRFGESGHVEKARRRAR